MGTRKRKKGCSRRARRLACRRNPKAIFRCTKVLRAKREKEGCKRTRGCPLAAALTAISAAFSAAPAGLRSLVVSGSAGALEASFSERNPVSPKPRIRTTQSPERPIANAGNRRPSRCDRKRPEQPPGTPSSLPLKGRANGVLWVIPNDRAERVLSSSQTLPDLDPKRGEGSRVVHPLAAPKGTWSGLP